MVIRPLPMMVVAAIAVIALTWFAAPGLSRAVMAQAQAGRPAPFLFCVTFRGDLDAAGWFSGPVLARAEASDPQVVITYSVNGGPLIQGSEILFTQPGQYQVTWNACKGEACREPFVQHIKIAPAAVRLPKPASKVNLW